MHIPTSDTFLIVLSIAVLNLASICTAFYLGKYTAFDKTISGALNTVIALTKPAAGVLSPSKRELERRLEKQLTNDQ